MSEQILAWLEKRFMGSEIDALLQSPWNDFEKIQLVSQDPEQCSKIIALFRKSGHRLKMRLLLEELRPEKNSFENRKSLPRNLSNTSLQSLETGSPLTGGSDYDPSTTSTLSLSRHNSTTTTISSDLSSSHSPDSSPRTSLNTPPSLDLSGSFSRASSHSNTSPLSSPSVNYLSSLPLASPLSIGSRPGRSGQPMNFVGPAENFPKATTFTMTTLPHHYPTIFKDSSTLPVLASPPDPTPPPRPLRPTVTSRSPSPSPRPQLPPRPNSRTGFTTATLGTFNELGQLTEEPEPSNPSEQMTS